MDPVSLFLAPSPAARRDHTATTHSALMDVVPFEAALQRLLYERISSDEQLASYGVQQAYRGLLYAVRAKTLTLPRVDTTNASALATTGPSNSRALASSSSAAHRGSDTSSCVVRGWQAVLYRLALAAVRSAEELECAVFLSVRVLCDPASAHGEGNERPCCTAEWTQAMLRGLPLDDAAAEESSAAGNELDRQFGSLVQSHRRYQLGYLLLASNTLRMVATGRVEGQHLCSHYPELFSGVATTVLPRVARLVEGSMQESQASADAAVAQVQLPTRFTVELNHFVLHGGHWLAMDTLAAHMDADDDGASEKKKPKKRPLILDRDQPACLWTCVTLVRNSLRRTLSWIAAEVQQQQRDNEEAAAQVPSSPSKASLRDTALLREVSQQVEGAFTDLLKRHEYVENALLNASRQYNGVLTRDVQALVEMKWAHTLQMCFLLRNLTGTWVSVHGGLGYVVLCADQLVPTSRDVLMFMASALLRIPSLETKKTEDEREAFLAVDAGLCALLSLVSAAPTPTAQTELWSSDSAVTQQVHALLVQRALRYHDSRVLKLSSLLSRCVLDATVKSGALAGFATDSADQLLEMLESDDDAATRCVGELLSVAILQHPYRLVPALFRLLQHGTATTRRNVLQVLASLPDVLSEPAADVNTSEALLLPPQPSRNASDRRREVLRLLAENLLLQLQDEELCVRLLSSSLFAKVHPSDVLRPLLNLVLQRDPSGRKQSAAVAALTSVMTAHVESAATFLSLLQCAYESRGVLRGASATSSDVSSAATASTTVDKEGSLVRDRQLHRPTPQTPGDILSQSLLYSAVDADDDEPTTPADDASNVSESTLPAASTAINGGGGGSGVRRKEAHLHRTLITLTDKWVEAARPRWTYEHHSRLLVQHLAQQAFGNGTAVSTATGAAAAAAAAELEEDKTTALAAQGADVEDQVQFFMKYTLRVFSASVGTANADAGSADSVKVRACHLLAVWTTFFADPATLTDMGEGDRALTWCEVVGCNREQLESVAQGSVTAKACVHAALLPLLCLRSCAPPGTLHSIRVHSLPAGAFSSSFAQSGCLSGAEVEEVTGALTSHSAAAVEEATTTLLSAVWRTLWAAVTQVSSTQVFFAAYPDIQRVVLEVLCRFPAAHFFSQWQHWRQGVAALLETTLLADAVGSSSEALFVCRVYLFGVSAYLADSVQAVNVLQSTAAATPILSAEANSTSLADLKAALDHRHVLVQLLTCVVPQWLLEDHGSAGSRENEAIKQRLCMAAVDAGGVLGIVALSYPQRQPVASHKDNDEAEQDEVRREAVEASNELLSVPLESLTLQYRAAEATASASSTTEVANTAKDTKETPWSLLLTRFQLSLRTHSSLLRAIAANPRGARPLLMLWFHHFLRGFIDLANAACKSDVGRAAHGCRAAVDACEAVFQAVLLARKVDDATASAKSTADSPTSAPTLCRLAYAEKDALVHFSVGCTRFAASPAVQTVGVRLLSALLVAAPELFNEVNVQVGERTTLAVQGGDALQSAASALQSVALMHADRGTRVLAEEVLRMLEKAYSTSSTAGSA